MNPPSAAGDRRHASVRPDPMPPCISVYASRGGGVDRGRGRRMRHAAGYCDITCARSNHVQLPICSFADDRSHFACGGRHDLVQGAVVEDHGGSGATPCVPARGGPRRAGEQREPAVRRADRPRPADIGDQSSGDSLADIASRSSIGTSRRFATSRPRGCASRTASSACATTAARTSASSACAPAQRPSAASSASSSASASTPIREPDALTAPGALLQAVWRLQRQDPLPERFEVGGGGLRRRVRLRRLDGGNHVGGGLP